MKLKLMLLSGIALFLFAGNVFAGEGHDHSKHQESMEVESKVGVVNVGNKICPVSGEKIDTMGEAFVVDHEGKSYNLCCKMCAKDFKKNPDKFIKKINEELEASVQK